MEKLIAVSFEEVKEFGCPYCGYRFAYDLKFEGNTLLRECRNCSQNYVVLLNGCEKAEFTLEHCPILQSHPLKK